LTEVVIAGDRQQMAPPGYGLQRGRNDDVPGLSKDQLEKYQWYGGRKCRK